MGKIKVTPLALDGVLLIEPQVMTDDRGEFFESYNARDFEAATGQAIGFVQDNQSRSMQGVLRGLHYQLPPYAQGKLVRVLEGEVLDVTVDIRLNSPTFGRWLGVTLSAANRKQLWIPPGFAHGFLTLSKFSEFAYKVSGHYNASAERTIAWNDPAIGIEWGILAPVLSDKDKDGALLQNAEVFERV